VTRFRSGYGAPWLDLLATLAGRHRDEQVEFIGAPDDYRDWLRFAGLEPTAAVTAGDVEQAHRTREALYRLAAAAVAGERPRAADVRVVNGVVDGDPGVRLGLGPAGLTLSRPATAGAALARLTRQAVHDLTGDERGQLRACADATCAGIYLDRTGRRRWCSDERCGNRARVRAHRARAAD
jgi:predicted RNA-binding Zn ribbon-like protein